MQACAVIVGAGSGKRLGMDIPKALVKVAGRPMVRWCAEIMTRTKGIASMVIVAPPRFEHRFEAVMKGINCPNLVVTGGATRTESVRIGVKNIFLDCSIVAIHDAARPLINPHHVYQTIKAAEKHNAAALAVPIIDTIKITEDEWIIGTQPRENLWAVQTPQAFNRSLLEHALELFPDDVNNSDDCSFIEKIGEKIKIIPGNRTNIKITYPEDLLLAEAVLSMK